MSTPAVDQISLEQFNPASRSLQASDLFYVYQNQYGEVALPAQAILAFVQKYLGVGLFVTNGAPDNSQGFDGDYAVDIATGVWYGPKTTGAWPGTIGLMVAGALSASLAASITQQITDAVIGGQGGPLIGVGEPASDIGINGQLSFDLQNGVVYGPKTNGVWGAGTALIASALTAALQATLISQVEAVLINPDAATQIGYGETTVGAELDVLSSQVAELQAGAAGSALTLALDSIEITQAHASRTVVFEGSDEVDPIFTMDPGSSFVADTFTIITNKASNPDAVLTVQLGTNGDYFSTAAYSTTDTGIASIALNYGDTLKIGFTATSNFVVLGGTALLQFSSTNASAPPLSDNSNRISTTGFGKTLRHGLVELDASTQNPYTVTDDESAYAILVFTGTLDANTLVYLPNRPGTYTLRNETTGDYQLSIGLDASDTDAVDLGVGLASYVLVREDVGVYEVASAEAVTSPTLTIYSTTIGNVSAGDTVISTGSLVSSLTNIFANGAFLTRGVDFNPNGKDIALTTPIVAGVNYVVLSATLINNSSLIYTPAVVSLTLPAGQTTLTYPYPVGFVDVYVGGAFETNVIATDGQTLVFSEIQDTNQSVVLRIYTPVIINGMLPLSGGDITGNLSVLGSLTNGGGQVLSGGNLGVVPAYTQSGAGAVIRTLENRLQEVVYASDFGVVGSGADESVMLLAAHTEATALGRALVLPPTTVNLGTASFSIDLTKTEWVNPGGAALQWSGAPSAGYGIRLVGTSTYLSTYTNARKLRLPTLLGSANAAALLAGSALQIGDGTNYTQGLDIFVNIQGFATAINYQDNVWMIHVSGRLLWGAINTPASPTNFGESMSFTDALFGDGVVLTLNDGNWCLRGGSLDNSSLVVNGASTFVTWDSPHFENPGSASNTILFVDVEGVNASVCLKNVCLVLDTVTGGITDAVFKVNSANTTGGLDIDGIQYTQSPNLNTSVTDDYVTLVRSGSGRVRIRRVMPLAYSNSYFALGAASCNQLANGGFENSSIAPWLASVAGSVTQVTTGQYVGKRITSAKAVAIAVNGTNTYVQITQTAPIEVNQYATLAVFVKSDGVSGHTGGVQLEFLDAQGNTIVGPGYTASIPYTQTSYALYTLSAIAPPGARWAYVILSNGLSTAPGSVYFDEAILNVA